MTEVLPEEVIARLDARQLDDLIDQRSKGVAHEKRRSAVVALPEEDRTGLRGYATIYDYPYEVAGGPTNGGWTETISRGACTKSLNERADVRLLFDHTGVPLARTKSGSMSLSSDEVGLMVEVDELDTRNPAAAAVVSALGRGDIDEMSFAFRAVRQEWNADYTDRRISEVALYDVSLVTYPANPATVVALRADESDEIALRDVDKNATDAATIPTMSLAYAFAKLAAIPLVR